MKILSVELQSLHDFQVSLVKADGHWLLVSPPISPPPPQQSQLLHHCTQYTVYTTSVDEYATLYSAHTSRVKYQHDS